MNIEEDYVSFETAKLLKEKGFNESVGFVYSENGELLKLSAFGVRYLLNSECDDYPHWQFPIEGVASIVSAPTLQMAMKWLRKAHDLHIIAYPWKADREERAIHWCCQVYKSFNLLGCEKYTNETLKSYEEAAEAAIRYCLEKLI